MAKSPFYTITVNGENITEKINSLDYEDIIKGDDLITFSANGLLINEAESDIFNTGVNWQFIFGFIGGVHSEKRKCIITNTEFDYNGGRVNLTITARDLGYLVKKVSGNFVYKNKTASQMANDIADKFGLQKDIDETSTLYDYTAIGNKNFMQFLNDVCLKEGTTKNSKKGGLEVYVSGDKLSFKNRDLSQNAKRIFEYGNPKSSINSVSIAYNDGQKDSSNEVQANGVDLETGEAFNATVKNEDNNETATGKKNIVFNVDGALISPLNKSVGNVENCISENIQNVPAENKTEAENKISKGQKDNKLQSMTLTLNIELDPTIKAGDIITLAGLSIKHIGNWRAEKVTHTINSSGGITVIEGVRNGAKAGSSKDAKDNTGEVNNSKGNENGKIEKKLDVLFSSQTGNKI